MWYLLLLQSSVLQYYLYWILKGILILKQINQSVIRYKKKHTYNVFMFLLSGFFSLQNIYNILITKLS